MFCKKVVNLVEKNSNVQEGEEECKLIVIFNIPVGSVPGRPVKGRHV